MIRTKVISSYILLYLEKSKFTYILVFHMLA
jgi:hypothetical protein